MEPLSKKRPVILVVDDNHENLHFLGSLLTGEGYHVHTIFEGAKLLQYLSQYHVDLILLNVYSEELNGFGLLAKLQEDKKFRRIPVIILTGHFSREDNQEGLSKGAVDFITMPPVKEEITARISLHIRLAFALRNSKRRAIKDKLTGTYNRRFAFEILKKQLKIIKREKSQMVLCLIDIDGLKAVNKKYGRKQGDHLIKIVSSYILENIRSSDYLFRIGGDEFLVLLHKCNMDHLEIILGRIREALEQHKIEGIEIGFSFGAVSINEHTEHSIKELLIICDQLMYHNKRNKEE